MTPATRSYVRHAGDCSAEQLAERDRKAADRKAALDARQAQLRETNPELADAVEAAMRRRRR